MTVAEMKLDVGSGAKHDEGYLTLDVVPYFKPDILGTLCRLPFADDHFDEVRCHHVLEHMERRDFVPAMNEMWRVLKPGGWVDIEVPVYPHLEAVADPTHLSFYHSATFEYFVRCDKKHGPAAPPGSANLNGGRQHMIHPPPHLCYEEHRILYGIKPWAQPQIQRHKYGAIVQIRMLKVTDTGERPCFHTRASAANQECLDCGERLES